MKLKIALSFLVLIHVAAGQVPQIESDIYRWNALQSKKDGPVEISRILNGSTKDFGLIDMFAVRLPAGGTLENSQANGTYEELIIVKEGKFDITLNGKSKTLIPGSVVLILPGDSCKIKNNQQKNSTFYSMMYASRKRPNFERGKDAGGSFMIDWNEIAFKKHERGSIRQYFERPTSMTQRFEMHVTTLNAWIKSHEPHTHTSEEIVLIVDGNVEMQIGDRFEKGGAGDVIFLGSDVLHALKNIGKKPCTYFAFQWE